MNLMPNVLVSRSIFPEEPGEWASVETAFTASPPASKDLNFAPRETVERMAARQREFASFRSSRKYFSIESPSCRPIVL